MCSLSKKRSREPTNFYFPDNIRPSRVVSSHVTPPLVPRHGRNGSFVWIDLFSVATSTARWRARAVYGSVSRGMTSTEASGPSGWARGGRARSPPGQGDDKPCLVAPLVCADLSSPSLDYRPSPASPGAESVAASAGFPESCPVGPRRTPTPRACRTCEQRQGRW